MFNNKNFISKSTHNNNNNKIPYNKNNKTVNNNYKNTTDINNNNTTDINNNNTKDFNNNNTDNNNTTDINNNNTTDITNNKSVKKENNEVRQSYSNFDIEKDYYILCPDCKKLYPKIQDIEYDKEYNDFIISYTCKCDDKLNNRKTHLLKCINRTKPDNLTDNYLSKSNGDKMLKIGKEKQIKGFEILEKIIKNEFDIGFSAAAPILKDSSIINSRSSTFGQNSKFQTSTLEKSQYNNKKGYKQSVMPIIKEEETIRGKKEIYKISNYFCDKTIVGHPDKILSLIQLQSGLIVTGSYNEIKIWNSDLDFIKKLQENGYVLCLLEFEKNIILVGTSNNNISLWNIDSKENRHNILSGHKLKVNSLVKCNNEFFASCSDDQTIIIWDYYNKKKIRNIHAHSDLVLCLILLKNGNLCSGGADFLIKFWNWNNGEFLYQYSGHKDCVKCLYQLKDETLLSGSKDLTIKIWTINDNGNHKDNDNDNHDTLYGHKHQINTLCPINDNYIASGSDDGTIKIWDLYNLKECQALSSHTSNVSCIIKVNNNNLIS
jgi:WD40 repeat protein